MPLKKFWKRIFNNNEVEFQALKSRSAVELSSYNRKSKINSNRNHMPRFYSHYENLESSLQHQQQSQKINNIANEDLFLVRCHKNRQPDQIMEEQKIYAVFCHMETKHVGNEYLEEHMNSDHGPESFVKEPTLAAALAVCHQFREHPQFREGVLLKSVESQSVYPYVHYAIFDQQVDDVHLDLCYGIYRLAIKNSVNLKVTQMHGVYEELSSMVRKSEKIELRLPTNRHTGYIIVAFKLLNYEHVEAMEKNWMDWSGAKDLYKCSPKSWNLKRMTFHKLLAEPNHQSHGNGGSFIFVLLCEFANLMNPENIVMGCDMVERLKLRYCGHVGLYRAQCTYTKSATSKSEWETFEMPSINNEGKTQKSQSVSCDLTNLI